MIWHGQFKPDSFYKLKELYITECQSLEKIWSMDRGAIFTFKNLYEVKVGDCCRLKSLFPASVAKDLEQLTLLEIYRCGVEEVVDEKEEFETSAPNVAFPRLTFLRLEQLPKLKNFYRGKYESRWPLLKELKICNCDKLKIQQTPSLINKVRATNTLSLLLWML